jgi:hypothetical protein
MIIAEYFNSILHPCYDDGRLEIGGRINTRWDHVG